MGLLVKSKKHKTEVVNIYSIEGGVIAAACLCIGIGSDAQLSAIPFILGGFMISNTTYHWIRLRWKEQ